MNVVVKCDRCKEEVNGLKTETATGGYYEVGPTGNPWGKYADPCERIVCDVCMWHDPRYQADYGPVLCNGCRKPLSRDNLATTADGCPCGGGRINADG